MSTTSRSTWQVSDEVYWSQIPQPPVGKVFGDKGTVASWYKNEAGVNWTLWPLDLVTYWWGTLACDMDLYTVRY